jgi:hypothetical protein
VWSVFPPDIFMKSSGSSMAASIMCGCAINFIGDCRMRNISINGVGEFMENFVKTFRAEDNGNNKL